MDINFSEILAKGKFDKRDFKISFEDGDAGTRGTESKRSMYGEGFIAYQFSSLKDAFDELNDLRKNQNLDDFQRTALANFNTKNWTKNFDDVIEKANEKSSTTTEFEKIADDFVANARDLVNIGGSIKKGKLKITDDKKGIFDFSLASLGLYRPLEFIVKVM